MLKMILCEESAREQARWRRMLLHLLFDREEFELMCMANAEELLHFLEQQPGADADLIFMDIPAQTKDGMRLAERVQERRGEARIVFVTEQKKYVFLGYSLHAYDYLLKPLTEEALEKTLNRYLAERNRKTEEFFMVNRRTGNVRIALRQVCYFASDRRKIRAVLETGGEPIEFYMKLDELEEHLRACHFLRVHQSYLINISKVRYWDGKGLYIDRYQKIPISRKYRNEVKEALDRYWCDAHSGTVR